MAVISDKKHLVVYKRPEEELWRTVLLDTQVPTQAVKDALTKEEILDCEYIVYTVDNSIHSDEFHNDGVFDEYLEDIT